MSLELKTWKHDSMNLIEMIYFYGSNLNQVWKVTNT